MDRDYSVEICGTCKHHQPDDTFPSDWLCVNCDSENCGDFTEYEDTCEFWEERTRQNRKGGEEMNKYFCDMCGGEISEIPKLAKVEIDPTYGVSHFFDVCENCAKKLLSMMNATTEVKENERRS